MFSLSICSIGYLCHGDATGLLKLCCVLHTADVVCGLPDLEETEPTEKEAEPVPPPPCPLLERADLSNFRYLSGTRGTTSVIQPSI